MMLRAVGCLVVVAVVIGLLIIFGVLDFIF
jgi:hypothetical protein